jgi:hypothetical protein
MVSSLPSAAVAVAAATTFKIQIKPERSRLYEINRSNGIPPLLIGRMNENEWNIFCDQIDEISSPINKSNKTRTWIMFTSLFGVFAGILLSVVLLLLFGDGSKWLLLSLLLPLGSLITLIYNSLIFSKENKIYILKLKELCDRITSSQQYQDKLLSFQCCVDERTVVSQDENNGRTRRRTLCDIYIQVSFLTPPKPISITQKFFKHYYYLYLSSPIVVLMIMIM